MQRLASPDYLGFPLKIGSNGPATVKRAEHVRQQIEQALFTNHRERVFRPQFGVGVRRLVFEPNSSSLREMTRKRLVDSLAEILQGEVDPKTLDMEATNDGEKLRILISYKLAAINQSESLEFILGGNGS